MPQPDSPHAERHQSAWQAPLIAAVVFGVLCRVSQFAAHTSLWHDEAYVALNVIHKTYAGLLGPLDWQEAAPPGFLWLEKLVVDSLGRSEYALRLVPLLAGVAGIVCFAVLVRQACSSAAAACWAVVLMAASDKLIAQANETKQFTLDLLCAVVLTQLALRAWHERHAIVALLVWGALGVCSVWLSFASAFVFAGTSFVLALRAMRTWHYQARTAYVVANVMVLASLALLLASIQAQLSGDLLSFWTLSFPDTSSASALIYWLGRSLLGLFNYFWQPLGAALILLAVVGCARASRHGRRVEVLVFVTPILLALVASFLHRWPFGGNQHMVFAGPAVLILVGEGTERLRAQLTCWRSWAGAMCVALLLIPGLAGATYHLVVPRWRHEVRPVIAFVQQHQQPDDQLLVLCPAEFEFYTGQRLPDAPVDPSPASRVWFIATRTAGRAFPSQDLLDRLAARRERVLAIDEPGAAAYLFAPEGTRAILP